MILGIVAPGSIRRACGAVSRTRLNSADSVLAPYLDHHQHLPREARRMTTFFDAARLRSGAHRNFAAYQIRPIFAAPFRRQPAFLFLAPLSSSPTLSVLCDLCVFASSANLQLHRILRRFSGGQSGNLFDVRESRRQCFLSFATFEPFGVGAGGCPGKGRESLRLCV